MPRFWDARRCFLAPHLGLTSRLFRAQLRILWKFKVHRPIPKLNRIPNSSVCLWSFSVWHSLWTSVYTRTLASHLAVWPNCRHDITICLCLCLQFYNGVPNSPAQPQLRNVTKKWQVFLHVSAINDDETFQNNRKMCKIYIYNYIYIETKSPKGMWAHPNLGIQLHHVTSCYIHSPKTMNPMAAAAAGPHLGTTRFPLQRWHANPCGVAWASQSWAGHIW